jgi:MFS family permease
LSDRIGRKSVVSAAYILYAGVYAGFAFLNGTAAMIVLFVLFGVFTAMITGAEKAMLTALAPKERKGTVLGALGALQGMGALLSSVIAGVLWELTDPMWAFVFGACLAVLAAAAMLILNIGGKSAKGGIDVADKGF